MRNYKFTDNFIMFAYLGFLKGKYTCQISIREHTEIH